MTSPISHWRSLSSRVTLVTLAIFVTGIGALAYFLSQSLREDMTKLLGEQQFGATSFVAGAVNHEIGSRLRALENVSSTLSPAVLNQTAALQAFLQERTVLQSLFNAGLIIYGRDGTALAEVPRSAERIGLNYMDRDFIASTLKDGKTTISPPVVGKKLRAPLIVMTVPIRDAQGAVIGAIAGVTNLKLPNFLDNITQGAYGKTGGYILVAPRERMIVVATDKSRIMEALPGAGEIALLDRFIAGYEGYDLAVNPHGVEILASGKGVPLAGWYASTVLPTAEAFAPIRAMQQRMLLATLLLTLLAAGLTWWYLKRQFQPMRRAALAMARLSESDQPMRPLSVQRNDEIGHLVSGFNRVLASLNQREALLRQILDTASVAIFLIDEQGRITQANRRMVEMFGGSLEALEGSDYVMLVHPSQREAGREKVLALLAGKLQAVDVDRLYWRADQTPFWGRLTGKRFFDPSGEARGLVGVIADITERKQAQDTLRATDQRLRDIVNTTDGIVWEADASTFTFTFISEQAERMLGFPLADWLQPGFWVEHLHPDDKTWAPAYRAACTGRLEAHDFEYRFIARDGRTIWLRDIVTVAAEEGKARWLRGLMVDITHLKQMMASLQASEERNRSINASAFDAIITADDAGNIVGWNPAAGRMFGYMESEILGQPLTRLMPARYRDRHLAGVVRVRSGGAHHVMGQKLELAGLRKNADEFPIELAMSEWAGQDGLFFTGIISDISARKASEAQVRLAARVFSQAHEGITVADAQHNIIMVNAAFTTITGYTEAEVLGKNPRVLTSGRQDASFYRAMWEEINTHGHWVGEIWNRHKDGTIYAEWLSISVMHYENGQVSHYIGSFSDLSATKAAESRIQWLSHFDTLTGLPNRALLEDRCAHSISMARRAGAPLSMMLVGIDHLKTLNDALGHEMGDALLIEMAKRLSDSVREQDTVGCLAGKEFVLVLPGTAIEGAAQVASELLWKLAQPYDLGDGDTLLTASIGIAMYPDNGADFDALLKAVEIAMHRAQVNGRDTFQFYNDNMYQQVWAQELMAKALRHAATLDQLQLVYQPLVDLQTGKISGLEALLRWQHPELGAVSPAQFIPIAESSGLIKGIGEWVLRRACRDMRAWLDKGIEMPHIAINVSPLQFRDDDLIAQVRGALSEWKIKGELIYLEVTESALMDDVPRSESMLRELKGLGVKLSLDDFGTGYSSLSYLKRFPFDKVKIDQSFVRDVTTNQSDKVLVNVIISMAQGLGMRVIAEGVETEAQCEIMRSSVCDEIQGYFFSRPVSAQAMEELLVEGRQLPPHLLRQRKSQRTLLLVDDEPNIVAALKRLLRHDAEVILTANSGVEGLDLLSRNRVDVIISDQRMPGMTGVEFLRAAKTSYPDTIRIVVSGFTELQSVTDAINEGAVYRFLTKPWDDGQLREHVQNAFAQKELLDENQQLNFKIRTANQDLIVANRQLNELMQISQAQSVRDQTMLDRTHGVDR